METQFSKLTEQDKVFDKLYLFNLLNKTKVGCWHSVKELRAGTRYRLEI